MLVRLGAAAFLVVLLIGLCQLCIIVSRFYKYAGRDVVANDLYMYEQSEGRLNNWGRLRDWDNGTRDFDESHVLFDDGRAVKIKYLYLNPLAGAWTRVDVTAERPRPDSDLADCTITDFGVTRHRPR
jgi:hypothetical protein